MANQSTLQFIPLSPLDNIMPRVYTRIILCIQTEKTADPSVVTALLSQGLRKTVEQIPLLDGEVVPDTTNADRLGRFAVTVSQPELLQLQSKDLTKKTHNDPHGDWKWSFEDLATENWQPGLFDGNILSPIAAFPDPFEESSAVMAAQANVIEGGILLCAAFHHRVMDGTGVGTVLRLWAQNCREIENVETNVAKDLKDIKIVENDVAKGNPNSNPSPIAITPEALDRNRLMVEKETAVISRPHPEYTVDPPSAPSTMPVPIDTLPEMEIEIFYFSGDALARLKDAAKGADDLTANNAAKYEGGVDARVGFHGKPVVWISTNDALSALLWSCITRARLRPTATEDFVTVDVDGGAAKPTVGEQESKLGMANNGRRKLNPPLPDEYMGNVNLYSLAVLPTSTLNLAEALPKVARSVRSSVNDVDDAHIRSATRLIDTLPDIAALKPTFAPFLGIDLAVTSWAELGLNGLDWGHAVGTVERVRVPALKFDGLCIVLPRTRDGGLEVLIGLTEDAMRGLATNDLFMRFAQVLVGLTVDAMRG